MLVDGDSHSRQSLGWEEVEIAAQVAIAGLGVDRGQGWRWRKKHAIASEQRVAQGTIVFRAPRGLDGAKDGRLVILQDLALASVELDAVAIKGDMASGHHDARPALVESKGHERGRCDPTTVHDWVAGVRHRTGDGAQDVRGFFGLHG